MKGALGTVPGVRKVETDFEKKEAYVTIDRSSYDAEALIAALDEAGYPESSIRGREAH